MPAHSPGRAKPWWNSTGPGRPSSGCGSRPTCSSISSRRSRPRRNSPRSFRFGFPCFSSVGSCSVAEGWGKAADADVDEQQCRAGRAMTDATVPPKHGPMRLWSVSALGIGSLGGAGIFALLGQAALMAGSDVYLSFAIGGVIALLSGYSYSRLAARFPSSGGIMDYFDRAFPSKVVAGGLSVLYLVTQIVSIAMIAKTFGAYADRLLVGDVSIPLVANMFGSAIVIALVVINMVGSGTVGRIEELLVAAKLIILTALLLAGVPSIDPAMLRNGPTVGSATLFASVGLTFFAYEIGRA